MCLIVFRWQPDNLEPLTLLSNRDEFYHRPSTPAHFWSDSPNIYGGRDDEKGGTWLAVSQDRKLSAVTNYREPNPPSDVRSRGEIVSSFLTSNTSAQGFAETLLSQHLDYPGFNALFFDGKSLVYSSNRLPEGYRVLEQGIYGLSNHLLDSPWPKLQRAKNGFSQIVSHENYERGELWSLMENPVQAAKEELPDTGVGAELEKMLSPIFIQSSQYGTRTTSLVKLNKLGEFHFYERNHVPSLSESEEVIQTIRDQ